MDYSILPQELLSTIFSFLTCKDLTSAVCVNSTWNSIANYDYVWKEAIFNSSFPHPLSYSQKDVPWRQFVIRHFQTKRNASNNSCVQHTLGTRSPTSKQRAEIMLRNHSSNDKYCLLAWEVMESHGYSYTTHDWLATELWDLETRTIVKNYTQECLELLNDYTINHPNGELTATFAKFDPDDDVLENKITFSTQNYPYIFHTPNEDPNSSLVAFTWSDWRANQKYAHIYDLRTGTKIFEKTFDGSMYETIDQFCGTKLVWHNSTEEFVLIIDVLGNSEICIKEPHIACATLVGNELWLANSNAKCLVKYNINTMRRQQYTVNGFKSAAMNIRVFDGLMWLTVHPAHIALVDVTSPTTCEVLKWITYPGFSQPDLRQLPNGTFTCLSSSYAHVLSFKDEDIELPIQVLQIQTTGKNEILDMLQGELNAKIAEYCPKAVTSQIVFESDTDRYTVVFSYATDRKGEVNKYVDMARDWRKGAQLEHHKSVIIQLVHFDVQQETVRHPDALRPPAFGPCWIVYETKVNGAWQRAAPHDYWMFVKSKLGLNY